MVQKHNPEAFKCYLDGERCYDGRDPHKMEESQKCFSEAIKHDKSFARAHGYLAYVQATIAANRESAVDKALLTKAKKSANKAVSLDAEDYCNHWDLAYCRLYSGDTKGCLKSYETALELYEDRTEKLNQRSDFIADMGDSLIYLGEHLRAIEMLERALRKPDWFYWSLAFAHYCAKDYDAALKVLGQLYRKPGDPRYPVGIELVKAATHVRLAERHPKGSTEAVKHMQLAQSSMSLFMSKTPKWTSKLEKERMPFVNAKDSQHWTEALEKAGLPKSRR